MATLTRPRPSVKPARAFARRLVAALIEVNGTLYLVEPFDAGEHGTAAFRLCKHGHALIDLGLIEAPRPIPALPAPAPCPAPAERPLRWDARNDRWTAEPPASAACCAAAEPEPCAACAAGAVAPAGPAPLPEPVAGLCRAVLWGLAGALGWDVCDLETDRGPLEWMSICPPADPSAPSVIPTPVELAESVLDALADAMGWELWPTYTDEWFGFKEGLEICPSEWTPHAVPLAPPTPSGAAVLTA
jgi:hypothetical protein